MNSLGPLILFLIIFFIFNSVGKIKKKAAKNIATEKTETPFVRKSFPEKQQTTVSDLPKSMPSQSSFKEVSKGDESPEGKDPCHEQMLQLTDSIEEESLACSEDDSGRKPLSFHRDDIINGMVLGEVLNRKSSAFGSSASFLSRKRQGM